MMLGCRATSLEVDDETGRVTGVAYTNEATGEEGVVRAHDTVLATGGFANDRTNTSLLAKHRPDLVRFPTTNGPWATGDGMKMAMAIGAGSIDMDKVQIHPTGFLDPGELSAPAKTLCGEMMRGVGGVLLTPAGTRFVNELLPRDQVVAAELDSGAKEFVLLLNDPMANEAGKHIEHYLRKGLMVKLNDATALARWMIANSDGADGQTAEQVAARADAADAEAVAALQRAIEGTLATYNAAAVEGVDEFGKTLFRHTPLLPASGPLYAGRIVPVLHYTMGGIRMGADGSVLRDDGSVILGLHAAGEVTGGVHGNNRLGGNSLLDCTVFGSIVGNKLAAELPARRAAQELETVSEVEEEPQRAHGPRHSGASPPQPLHEPPLPDPPPSSYSYYCGPSDCITQPSTAPCAHTPYPPPVLAAGPRKCPDELLEIFRRSGWASLYAHHSV